MNNSFGISEKSYEHITQFFKNEENVEEVIIFGSRAMGNYKKGSDVDLAVKGKKLTYKEINHIYFILNEELPIPYFVDIIHYDTLENEALKKHIDEEGKSLIKVKQHS